MKKFFWLMLLVVFVGTVNAQKIIVNEIDKFTKEEVIQTSFKDLYTRYLLGMQVSDSFSCSLKKSGDTYVMFAKIMTRGIVKYDEDSGIIFLLANGESVRLKTSYTGIASTRIASGYLFETAFILTESDVEKLRSNNVVATRLIYMGEYFDRDLKSEKQKVIAKMFKLIEDAGNKRKK